MPPLPSELRERPGIQWLYLCRMAGLSMSDLAHMRIDTAEALIELHDFVQDHLIHSDEDGKLVYDGNFSGGQFDGSGKYYQNGALIYDGDFYRSQYHGNGKLFDESGWLIYDGGFYYGRYDGQGREFYQSGALKYEGTFRLGDYAAGTWYAEDGSVVADTSGNAAA